jgi:L-rhamnose mutarotase
MPQRRGFVLEVRPDKVDAYVAAHAAVWPELLAALTAAGVRNYTIFQDGTRMFGYYEADDIDAAERYMAAQEVSERWREAMSGIVQEPYASEGTLTLGAVFRLD